MNNRIFSWGLYRETLRRIKIPAIIMLAILVLNAIATPIEALLSSDIDSTYIASTGSSAMPILYVVFIIAAPAMTWLALSFLNNRNSSDYYHSLPHTRLCIFTSIISAVLSVIVGMIFLSGGICYLLVLILPCKYMIIPGTLIKFMLGCLAASVLTSGAVAVAVTVTGRPFSNIIVATMILFLPRIFITIIFSAVQDQLPMVTGSLFGIVDLAHTNIVFSTFYSVIEVMNGSYTNSITTLSAQIYTAVLGLIYIVLSAVLFCKRNSESAERSAPSRILQAIYRISATMLFCLFICGMIFTGFGDLFSIVVLYLVALIIYFAYELITTGSIKNLVRIIPGLAIVLVLNVAVIGVMYGIYYNELNYTPSADNIDSISLVYDQYDYSYDISHYIAKSLEKTEITDKTVLNTVSGALKENIDTFKSSTRTEYSYKYENSSNNYVPVKIKINSGISSKERLIYLTSEQYAQLSDASYSTNNSAKSAKDTVLKLLDKAISDSLYTSSDNITDAEQIKSVFDAIKEDVKALDRSDWLNVYNSTYTMDSIYFTVIEDGNPLYVNIRLIPELFPGAVSKYFSLIQENSVDLDEIKEAVSDCSWSDTNIYVYNKSGSYDTYYYTRSPIMAEDNVFDLLTDDEIKIGDTFVIIKIYPKDNSTVKICTAKFTGTTEDIAKYFNIGEERPMEDIVY